MQPIILTFDMKKMMQYNIFITIFLVILLVCINLIAQPSAIHWSVIGSIKAFFLFCMYYTVLIILHEICHLCGFIVFGRAPLSSISLGFKPKEGIAYATTTKTLSIRAMKASLLLPFWLTGVIPTLLGFYTNSYTLIIVGAFLMAGAVGDFMMYHALRKFPNHYLVKDDSQYPRLYVYKKV